MDENIEALSKRRKFLGALKDKAKNINISQPPPPLNKCIDRESTENWNITNNNELNVELYCHETFPIFEEETTKETHELISVLICSEELIATVDPFHNSDNSRDADYVPENDEFNDSNATIPASPTPKMNVCKKMLFSKQIVHRNLTLLPANEDGLHGNQVQSCEYKNCTCEIFSTCSHCFAFLCWIHFENESTFNDCGNHLRNQFDEQTALQNVKKQAYKSKQQTTLHTKNIQTCEYVECTKNVQSTCENCFCFLCLDHFQTQDKGSCGNHVIKMIIPAEKSKKKKKKKVLKGNEVSNKDFFDKSINKEDKTQHCEYSGCTEYVGGTCEKCNCLLCLDHYIPCSANISCENHKPSSTEVVVDSICCTREGHPRKRKLFEEDLASRKKKKEIEVQEQRSLKEPCKDTCKKKCTQNFNENERIEINKKFVSLNYEAGGLFIKGLINVKPVKTRRQNVTTVVKRDAIYAYYLQSSSHKKIEVCKSFFLATLGYDSKNDRRVMTAIKKPIDKQQDLRGKYSRKNKIDTDLIKAHVMKYEPSVAHYRREHAPNRLYLPSDVNINIMFKDFCSEYPEIKISCETYRKIVRNVLNISFAHLGHEECEQCAVFKEHNKNHTENENCEICQEYKIHKSKYTSSRKEYKKDVDIAQSDLNIDTIFDSVDLQKVIMLPRIDQYKVAIFCPRIIAFNESFVPLGPNTEKNKTFAVLWNETISGRNQEDIVSAFRAFFVYNRDIKHVILWMDNCAAQNKNWCLFSFLISIINSDLISTNTICFKYFEPGHSFMSADSFHHQVELSLQRKGKVYDFDDFVDAVKLSNNKKNVTKVMQTEDFYNYKDLSSQSRLRKLEPRIYLKNMVYVKAERGNFTLKYKLHHEDQSEHTLDFLMWKYIKKNEVPEAVPKSIPRGISNVRKAEIISKLVPLMPENRRRFWYNLPEFKNNDATV